MYATTSLIIVGNLQFEVGFDRDVVMMMSAAGGRVAVGSGVASSYVDRRAK
jgi:hypothetical protein